MKQPKLPWEHGYNQDKIDPPATIRPVKNDNFWDSLWEEVTESQLKSGGTSYRPGMSYK